MFKSEMLSVIRADVNVIFSKIISPDEKISAIGRRTDVNFEHAKSPPLILSHGTSLAKLTIVNDFELKVF